YNVWETARRHGVKRIVFASSNHAIGMYPRTELLDSDSAARPDTFYGLGKAFGELLGRMYFDKHGIEAACLRIGSCFPKPKDARMLSTWLSYADFAELCRCCLTTPLLGYAIVYGVSANERCWWDNRKVSYIGFRPKDSAEPFAAEVLAGPQPDPTSPTVVYQGGSFAANGYTRT
ncbi:MAG: NAD(P)-dependent oxidoreductase, partial [Gammaproteobacteria bacterium]